MGSGEASEPNRRTTSVLNSVPSDYNTGGSWVNRQLSIAMNQETMARTIWKPRRQFYVIAGWAAPDNTAIAEASVVIESLRQKHCKDAAELKFKTFRKKPWTVSETMTRLGKIGLIPIYVIAEKRYCVAGKIIETFLDPYYNDRLSMPFTYDLPTKQELANTLYERFADDVLRQFAAAYRDPTQKVWKMLWQPSRGSVDCA